MVKQSKPGSVLDPGATNHGLEPGDRRLDFYPVAIIEDRYGGTYSGGRWLAVAKADQSHDGVSRVDFVLGIDHSGPHADDVTAVTFWSDPPDWITVGNTPQEAMDRLYDGTGARRSGQGLLNERGDLPHAVEPPSDD